MISLNSVSDYPYVFGARRPMLSDASLDIAQGRYAVLSRTPELHRALIDVLAGLRPPLRGFVAHEGRVSWPIGRQGFVRGKVSGLRMIEFVCTLYDIDPSLAMDTVGDLVSSPEYLVRPIEDWPLYMRQEFSFALALAPAFDVYIIDGAMPFEPCRFTRLWLALFEERLVGRTLIFSTYRRNQMADYCTKALIHERGGFRIEDDLDQHIREFPSRPFRNESADPEPDLTGSSFGQGQFDA
ncbi:P-loop NTPase family protein [Candidimonas nitroreducens]|uniref:ATPase n=1 Tax=Candidimonas nitroreducens TaxID=683354 RepID=A0A225MJQ5_9BURK|nr:ATPase [Candidimonas nitroreducens]OWT60563.1 ATPase [Candidimonas nitroreducens]